MPTLLQSALPLASLLLLPALLRAQAPAPPPPPPPDQTAYTLHANSRLVLTDVTVTDRNGNPVHNLPASAFHILDGKTPQNISSFQEHIGVATAPAEAEVRLQAKGTYSNDLLLHPPPVLNVVVLDITNLQLEDQMYLSYELTRFLNALPAGESLAIYQRAGPVTVLLQNFTSDRSLLLAAVHRFLPRFPPRGAVYLSDLDTLQQIATYLDDFPGRKNILWFSGGSTLFLNPEATGLEDDAAARHVYDLLEASRIAIYPIDARGLTVAFGSVATIESLQHSRMSDVAEATGGRAFINTNGLQQAAAKVTSSGGDFYSLTYSPQNYREDRKWHKVHVSLDIPGYSLSYRRGYFADHNGSPGPSPHSTTHLFAGGKTATEHTPASTLPIVFEARVLPSSDPANASVQLPAASSPTSKPHKGAIPYTIHYTVPAESITISTDPDGKTRATLIVAAFAFSQGGEAVDRRVEQVTLSVIPERLQQNPHAEIPIDMQLQLTKGELYLLLAVLDRSSNRSGNLGIPLDVPAPTQGKN